MSGAQRAALHAQLLRQVTLLESDAAISGFPRLLTATAPWLPQQRL